MSPQEKNRPTDAELEILAVLWDHGPSTVRQVHEKLARPTGYTTVLKLLQIMTEKQFVVRDESERSHVYTAKHRQGQMQKRLVKDLVDRAFAGAADKLVMQALSSRRLSEAELANIRELLDDIEGKRT